MYGVESIVDADYRGRGVGSKLMDARFHTLKQLNLRGMVAGSAIIDYHTAAHLTPEQYVQEVVAGVRFDTNLSKQLHKGFKVHNIIPNYLPPNEGSLGYGVTIVWYNPDYRVGASAPHHITRERMNVTLRPSDSGGMPAHP
ncbi:MAG: hypothetical protein ACOYL5_17530 [Phototrophicaceae bacterium]|jgi:ribosomal protein S18 acetylase RimI-like enzyme